MQIKRNDNINLNSWSELIIDTLSNDLIPKQEIGISGLGGDRHGYIACALYIKTDGRIVLSNGATTLSNQTVNIGFTYLV